MRRAAQSLCPVCLRRVDAVYESQSKPGSAGEDHVIVLRKTCPEHGTFSVPVWRGHGFEDWARPKIPSAPPYPETAVDRGCPYDCGLCSEHGQHTCTALMEVTQRCNLRCPVCYADAGDAGISEPDLPELRTRFADLRAHAGRCNLQLSGGEPTVRDDLPDIIAAAAACNFGMVQLNTNGLRLCEPGYAVRLCDAGLDSVYLQWDGLDDTAFVALRGQALLQQKKDALAASVQAGLGVVLVMTVLFGINDDQLGAMLRFAAKTPGVRGLHIQPAAFFGRFPGDLLAAPRLTLPEIMFELEAQSDTLVRRTDFHPPGCEHALCSFSAVYGRSPQGGLDLLRGESPCCGPLPEVIPAAAEGARKARAFVAGHWKEQGPDLGKELGPDLQRKLGADFGSFVANAGVDRRFTLSCMAFQDALSVDLDRVRGCCIHVSTPGGRVPFCLYNLTSIEGQPLYRNR